MVKKIRLIQTEQDAVRGGDFLNLCLVDPEQEKEWLQKSSLLNFDIFTSDNELEELQIIHTLECLPAQLLLPTLDYYVNQKMRINGIIIILGLDCYQLCKQYTYHRLSLEEMNQYLYNVGGPLHQSILTLENLSSYLPKQGFKILQKEYQGIEYLIKAQKNG